VSTEKPNTESPAQVGYGRPPAHSRFRKGQSGNPKGRPRIKERGATDLIKRELNRLIQVREGGTVTRMTALNAVVRSQIAAAAKGSVPAQRHIVNLVRDIEAEARARSGGGIIRKNQNKDINDMTDEELMAVVGSAQDYQVT